MEIFVCKYSDKGGRSSNEDAVGISDNTFVLADGLGGHSFGEVASSKAVEYLLGRTEISDISSNTMHDIIDEVNRYIWREKAADSSYGDMASTVVAAFVRDGYFNYFNVGDSRMYYFRNGKIFIQSKDHSMTQLSADMGEISREKMRFHEDRNKLTKVLGLRENLKINQSFEPFKIMRDDAFLLCSDGFWEYISEKQMIKSLNKSKTPNKWLETMLKIILHKVKEGNDNLSAVCGMVK